MKTIWVGRCEIAAERLIRDVANDIEWLEEQLQDIQKELECKQELLKWLDKDAASIQPFLHDWRQKRSDRA